MRGFGVAFTVIACVLGPLAFPQSRSGSLAGAVVAPDGSFVAGANVEAVMGDSGVTLRTVASEGGFYVFPNLPTGVWTVSVTKDGFKKLVRPGIQIFIAQRQTLDLQMEIGDVMQSLEVTATQTMLETDSSMRGQSLTPKMFQTLPRWQGGLQNPSAFLANMAAVHSLGEMSIAGSTGRAREQLIDGTSNVIPESGGTVFNPPSAESFSEVKLLAGNFTAEFGRVGGGIEVFTTRSGTNALHGTWGYHMLRDIWNAAGWSVNQNRANAPGFRPKARLNAIAGGIGGTVSIPKIYDGRSKTFFYFVSDNDLRPSTPRAIVNTVPTVAMTQGDFRAVPQLLYDPATTNRVGSTFTRSVFPNNRIPLSRFSRISGNIIPYIAAPTSPVLNNNHAFVNTQQLTDHVWSIKLDHNFSDRNRLAYFQSWEDQVTGGVADFNGPLGTAPSRAAQQPHIYRVNHDYTFSPAIHLYSTFGYSTTVQQGEAGEQRGFGTKFGFPGLTSGADVTPRIQFAPVDGYTAWGVNAARSGQDNYTPHVTQSLSVLRGKHDLKMGWDFRLPRTYGYDFSGTSGSYFFARAQTANPGALATTGNSFASFLLGAPDAGSITPAGTSAQEYDIRYRYHAVYFQDNWKVTPRLTLNLGLRYEVPLNWTSPTMSSVSLTLPNPGANGRPGAYVFPGDGPGRLGIERFWPTDYSNIGPTIGFAYAVNPKTVVRGGWSIVYEGTSNGGCGCTLGNSGAYTRNSDGLNPAFVWEDGIPPPPGYQPPPNIGPSIGNGRAADYMGPTFGNAPRIFHWGAGVQREWNRFLVEIEYAGNRGHGLNSTIDLNQVKPSYLPLGALLSQNIAAPAVAAAGFTRPYPSFTGTLAQALRPYPQFLNVLSRNSGLGRTWYESGTVKVSRRFGAWQFSTSYVRSKTLGLLTYRQQSTQNQVFPQDMYNLEQGKSYLFWDLPNVFNLLSSYDLPFGRGRRWLGNSGRLLDTLAGGWTIANVHNYRSGAVLPILCPNTLGNGVLFTNIRQCDLNPGTLRSGQDRGSLDPNNPASVYFNSGVLSIPAQFAFGTSAQTNSQFRRPNVFSDNIAIVKQVGLWPSGDGNRIRLQLRADAFNAFNRTNFAVNGTVGNANFGRATVPQNEPRTITMGLRLWF